MTRGTLARTTSSSPLGKLTFQVKANLPEYTGELLNRELRALGMSQSEFLRDLIMFRLHGGEYVRRLYDERLAVVAGNVPEPGQGGAP